RGSKRQLCYEAGILSYLGHCRILLKEYTAFVKDSTATLCQAIEKPAEEAGLYVFLNNCQDSKEEEALKMAAKHGLSEGLIAVIGCVEPCRTTKVRANHKTKKLELHVEPS